MQKIYFTSDLHFGHDRAFIYEPRGFTSVEEMNEEQLKRYNSIVNEEDEVYILGDLTLGPLEEGAKYLRQLHGKIHVVLGNHDSNRRTDFYKNLGWDITYARVLKYKGYSFYLSHYPTLTSNLENGAPIKQHMINLYGHTHQKKNFYMDIPYMYHVGVDSHECYPVEINTIIADILAETTNCIEML